MVILGLLTIEILQPNANALTPHDNFDAQTSQFNDCRATGGVRLQLVCGHRFAVDGGVGVRAESHRYIRPLQLENAGMSRPLGKHDSVARVTAERIFTGLEPE